MKTFAVISRRALLIAGHPNSGWSIADDGTPGSAEVDFRFEVTDDGGGNYLLLYTSLDGRYAADSWHETLAGALASASEEFGIQQEEWST